MATVTEAIMAIMAKMISCGANLKTQFLQRNLRKCNREIKLQCYKTYIRPIIQYASPV